MIKDQIFPLIILYYFTNKSPIIEDEKHTLGINQRKQSQVFETRFIFQECDVIFFNTSLLSVHIVIIYFF